jgi:hypothetical protein
MNQNADYHTVVGTQFDPQRYSIAVVGLQYELFHHPEYRYWWVI